MEKRKNLKADGSQHLFGFRQGNLTAVRLEVNATGEP